MSFASWATFCPGDFAAYQFATHARQQRPLVGPLLSYEGIRVNPRQTQNLLNEVALIKRQELPPLGPAGQDPVQPGRPDATGGGWRC